MKWTKYFGHNSLFADQIKVRTLDLTMIFAVAHWPFNIKLNTSNK